MKYIDFVKGKVVVAEKYGIDTAYLMGFIFSLMAASLINCSIILAELRPFFSANCLSKNIISSLSVNDVFILLIAFICGINAVYLRCKYTENMGAKKPIAEFNFIYTLIDPITNEIRYVGKSVRPKERLQNQCNEKSNTYRCHWVQSLLKLGLRPIQIIIEKLPLDQDWQSRERYWIKKFREDGFNLTNCTDGGDGVPNLSGESKERMAKTWVGRKHKPETLLKISAASKGRKKTPEQKEVMRLKMLGRKNDWGNKVSMSMRKVTPEMADQIKSDLANGMTRMEASLKYKVDRSTISKVKHDTYFSGLAY